MHITKLKALHLFIALLVTGLYLLVLRTDAAHATDAVVGTGTLQSCTEAAFDSALATVQASQAGEITFNCGGPATIIFSAVKIITVPVVIDGGDAISLSGANAIRPFYVEIGADLTLRRIVVSNGFDDTYGGGAILNLGTLTLEGTTILNSNVDANHSGGAIMSLGPVKIDDSLIENNAGGSAGGLYLFGEAADATITNGTFRNNRTTNSTYGLGGAITTWDGADLIVRGSTFTENEAQSGGAIYNESANTTVLIEQNSVLHGNLAFFDGGGIYSSAGEIALNQVTLTENVAGDRGGGLYVVNGSEANLFNVILQANRAGLAGGGIRINGSSLSLIDVTLWENSASVLGGGIANVLGSVSFINGTVSNNVAMDVAGGISNFEGNMALTHVTFSGNSADQGGGVYHYDADILPNSFTLKNVLFNAGADGGNCYVPSESLSGISSAGFNLSSDYSCPFNQTVDREGVDPRLGPLADNGGFTQTHMPLADSPAIDGGLCVNEVTTDQRGVERPQGGACDIGAVERQPDDDEGGYSLFLPVLLK